MKIIIKDFGPLDHVEFDMSKDLHMIFGKNAIGKSYSTYCLYSLIKNISNIDAYGYGQQDRNLYRNLISENFSKLKKNESVDIQENLLKLFNQFCSDILLEKLEISFKNTFSDISNLNNRYSLKNFQIRMVLSENESLDVLSDENGFLTLKLSIPLVNLKLKRKSTVSTKFSLLDSNKMIFGAPNEDEFYYQFTIYAENIYRNFLRKLKFDFKDIYYLPASRSGLYQALNAFTPILAELTQSRFFISNKTIELPSLSEPVSDYFIDLSTLDPSHSNKYFEEIANSIEKEILSGKVKYDDTAKRIMYKPDGIDLELNLSEASSMVAELSPMVLYFRHILNNKYSGSKNLRSRNRFYFINDEAHGLSQDILFIEEPEAHLHPEVQVKLMSLFTKVVAFNVKIIITTHSNYMFNKLNNLILSQTISSSNLQIHHLEKLENGTVDRNDMKVTDVGIMDNNFKDVAEKLYSERFEILQSKND